jgi:hypothetical protein
MAIGVAGGILSVYFIVLNGKQAIGITFGIAAVNLCLSRCFYDECIRN